VSPSCVIARTPGHQQVLNLPVLERALVIMALDTGSAGKHHVAPPQPQPSVPRRTWPLRQRASTHCGRGLLQSPSPSCLLLAHCHYVAVLYEKAHPKVIGPADTRQDRARAHGVANSMARAMKFIHHSPESHLYRVHPHTATGATDERAASHVQVSHESDRCFDSGSRRIIVDARSCS